MQGCLLALLFLSRMQQMRSQIWGVQSTVPQLVVVLALQRMPLNSYLESIMHV
jgi:hypothetical protein